MASLSPARRAALKVFAECRRRDARARDLLRESDAVSALEARDRALATRLVLGAAASRGELDRVIASHLTGRAKLEPLVRDALRIVSFEILYLDTPTRAAVSQGVELARFASRRASGLANAVLRRVAEEDLAAVRASRALVESGSFNVDDLRRVGGLPEWLASAVLRDLGPEGAAAYALRALEPACASVAANIALHSPGECEALLREARCEPAPGPVPGSFVLGRPSALAGSGLVERCDVLPCDLAAQDVVARLGTEAGAKVLEVGQGRGTKSILMASAGAELTSVEVDAWKSELAAKRMATAGVGSRVHCVCDDGQTLEKVDGLFDLVFVDAPCSGSGTLTRHPEIAWSLEPASIGGLAELQLCILRTAATRVREGGRLAYSTCSVLRREDEDVIDAFLASSEGAGFELQSASRVGFFQTDVHFLALLSK